MRQSLRYASWLLLLFILLSCSHRVTGEATALPPILQAEAQSQKYNLQLDFMKHHFSGMLIVRQMPDNEIRILGSTYFGLSLFDFSLHCDTFIVNSCIEPMRKKKMKKHVLKRKVVLLSKESVAKDLERRYSPCPAL